MADLNETLKALKIMYIKKLNSETLPLLQSFLNKTIDYDAALEVRAIIHKISGTGGMYGLKELSEHCCEFEILLNQVRDNAKILNEDVVKTSISGIIKLITVITKESNCQTS